MIQTLIVSLSCFGFGVVAFLAVNNLRQAKASHGGERRLNLAYAAARFGIIIVLGLITEAVFHAPSLPITWRVVLYSVGLVLFSFGYLGIAIEGRRGTLTRRAREPRDPGGRLDV